MNLAADLVDGGRQFFRRGSHRLHTGGRLFGSDRDRRRQLLRTLRGGGQRTSGRFKLGRSRGYGLDDLADQRFEIARDRIHSASAFDLGFGVKGGCVVGGLFRNQRFLEHLQGIRHNADLGYLAPMRHFGGKVSFAKRLHRLDDRSNALRDVADQIEAHRRADDDGGAKDGPHHHQGRTVGIGCNLRLFIGAIVVELDILRQDLVRRHRNLVHQLHIQFMRLTGNLAGGLAGQRHDFPSALLVVVPKFDPFLIERALFRRCNHRLVLLTKLVIAFDSLGEPLFDDLLLLQRVGQQMLPQQAAIGDDAGAQFAEHADAWQPVGRDLGGVGVQRPHVDECEQTHARQGNEQQRDNRRDLDANRALGQHGWILLELGAFVAPDVAGMIEKD
jgi:hypothetical protein